MPSGLVLCPTPDAVGPLAARAGARARVVAYIVAGTPVPAHTRDDHAQIRARFTRPITLANTLCRI